TTMEGKARAIATAEILTNSPDSFFDDIRKYDAVTPADVQRVARTYLNPNWRSTVRLLPGGRP
ncbi:MAG: insulinase family protein, partial [Bdellovibrionaceae bacterium]|nr:insulinase family protein [Pseudobdellovibrionaceae bacterium]